MDFDHKEHEFEELKLLKALDEGTASHTGEKFFGELVRNLAILLNTKGAWVTEFNRQSNRLRALSFWMDNTYIPDYEYPVKGTPCEYVIDEKRFLHIKENVIELYPDDPDLKPFNAVSYLGAPLVDQYGQILGNLAILDDSPLPAKERIFSIFRIFAARASAELQRIRNENAIRTLQAETTYLREEIFDSHNEKRIIGSSPAIKLVQHLADKAAPTDATVLITGETGTGKELFALRIHEKSHRKDKPFVKLNCATIPSNLIESELFGHVKGAYTGATASRDGRFKVADKGTLFLDEIGELPLELQAKLLRVLQEGEFEAVGSSETIKTDVRIVAATNRDLLKMIRENKFRDDLYYRLYIFPIHLPPLRERKEDLLPLAQFFAEKFSKQYKIPVTPLTGDQVHFLESCRWPGNIRELQNLMERAVLTSQNGWLNLAQLIHGNEKRNNQQIFANHNDKIFSSNEMKQFERLNLIRALQKAGGKVAGKNGAAELIGIPPSTFTSRMKTLEIRVEEIENL